MPPRKPLARDAQFHNWTVIGDPVYGNKTTKQLCRCRCGTERLVNAAFLVNGASKSCGCHRSATSAIVHRVHGGHGSRLYYVWLGIKSRCYQPKHIGYHNYGGRGITMCPEWRGSYATFHEWATSNGYMEGLAIDRRNNDGGYSPDNCRWVTRTANGNNRRNNVLVAAFGETKTVAEWSRDARCKVRQLTLANRVRRRWKPELALTVAPYQKPKSRYV